MIELDYKARATGSISFFILFSVFVAITIGVVYFSRFSLNMDNQTCYSETLVKKNIDGIKPFVMKNNNPVDTEILPENNGADTYLMGFMAQSIPEDGYISLHLCNVETKTDIPFVDGEMHKISNVKKKDLEMNGYGEFYSLLLGKEIKETNMNGKAAFKITQPGTYEISVAFSPDGKDWYIAGVEDLEINSQ